MIQILIQFLKFMHDFLAYPVHFIQFISLAKVLGTMAMLIPGLLMEIILQPRPGLYLY